MEFHLRMLDIYSFNNFFFSLFHAIFQFAYLKCCSNNKTGKYCTWKWSCGETICVWRIHLMVSASLHAIKMPYTWNKIRTLPKNVFFVLYLCCYVYALVLVTSLTQNIDVTVREKKKSRDTTKASHHI